MRGGLKFSLDCFGVPSRELFCSTISGSPVLSKCCGVTTCEMFISWLNRSQVELFDCVQCGSSDYSTSRKALSDTALS